MTSANRKHRTDQSAGGETHIMGRAGDSVSSEPAASSQDGLPEMFGRYRIVRQLGAGAMGAVYLAHDTQLDRPVALKVPKFRADEGSELRERFLREARAAAMLHHRNICTVHDVGEIDGRQYLTMNFVEGRPLSAFIQPERPLPMRHCALLVRKLAGALRAAHEKGIVHRDLKPANVMIDQDREPVIMDFGLARQVNLTDGVRLTQSGAILGSPAYMSPEQVEGHPDRIGPPSDIYSLGVVLYELLTGRLPFNGSVAAVLGKIATNDPPPPSELRADVDPRLEAICLKMMARQTDDRYDAMGEVADALTAFLKNLGTAATSSFHAPAPEAKMTSSPTSARKPSRKSKTIEPTSLLVLRRLTGSTGGKIGLGVVALLLLALALAFSLRSGGDATGMVDSDGPLVPDRPLPATPRPQATGLEGTKAGQEQDDNGLKMKLVWCPPGTFTMGSPPTERGPVDDRENQVQVTLTRGFWLGKYEVTQSQWRQVMGSEPWKGSQERVKEGADYPAVFMNWHDATEFCRRFTTQERQAGRLPDGWEYTLPTEAQWEYACRAGTQTAYSFGDHEDLLGEYAWYIKNTRDIGEEYAHEVGLKQPNPWGLHDMHGNVWEWCRDWFSQGLPGGRDPEVVTETSSFRVNRGGGWFSPPRSCRSAARFRNSPSNRHNALGFRVARVASGQ